MEERAGEGIRLNFALEIGEGCKYSDLPEEIRG